MKKLAVVLMCVGMVSMASAAITYVDATPNTDGSNGNTTIDGALVDFTAGTGNATPGSGASSSDGKWNNRSKAELNGGKLWETGDDEVTNSPLVTSVTLAPGIYDVYGIYVSQVPTNNNPLWMASFSIDGGNTYTDWTGAGTNPFWPNSGTAVDSDDYTTTVTEGINVNICNYQAYLGQVAVTDTLTVYIDSVVAPEDAVGSGGNDDRTWYDGIGYEYVSEIPEPATIGLLGMGMLTLIRRRK